MTFFLQGPHRIIGSCVGNRQDSIEALKLAAVGDVNTTYKIEKLENLPDVFECVAAGKLAGRIVKSLNLRQVIDPVMSAQGQGRRSNARLPPEVNRVLYVRNLPFKISSEELYDIFGKYGAIRQIRLGVNNDTRGTAFVVYEDIYDAKNAVDHLSGFNVCGRYLIVLYYQANKMQQRKGAVDITKQKQELQDLKDKYGVE